MRSRRRWLVAVALAALCIQPGCSPVRQFIARPLARWQSGKPKPVRSIAVLPLAFRDGEDVKLCDICPHGLVMAPTSADEARLVTGFVYEALTRYPRFEVVPFEEVMMHAAPTMDETIAGLSASMRLDAVVVGALLEMRERLGDPREPERLGGASIYMAAIEVATAETLWVQLFDATKRPPNALLMQTQRLIGYRDQFHYSTSEEIAQYGVHKLVKSLSKSIR